MFSLLHLPLFQKTLMERRRVSLKVQSVLSETVALAGWSEAGKMVITFWESEGRELEVNEVQLLRERVTEHSSPMWLHCSYTSLCTPGQ